MAGGGPGLSVGTVAGAWQFFMERVNILPVGIAMI
jgi:hypothetical protein